MNVLISIQQPVRAWQIPLQSVETIRQRFPDLRFTHATDDVSRAKALVDCDVAFTWLMNEAELATCTRLRWVHTSAVAVETFCLPELVARQVIVSNSRGVQSAPIAEHVFAVLLALAKRLPYVVEQQRERHWAQNEMLGDRLPWLIKGKTLGLIGAGTIGSEIARLAAAFGMKVVAITRRPRANGADDIEWMKPGGLNDLLHRSDVVVIAAPLTPETLNMIGAGEMARMKRGAVLINVGRARIVDHVALSGALRSGHLGGASLDVFHREPLPADDPLWAVPNLILTPHTSGFRQGHWDDVIELFCENLRRFQRGEPVRFRVEPELGY
jgi:phosphoglycerate dehydrogenase-like enzyme